MLIFTDAVSTFFALFAVGVVSLITVMVWGLKRIGYGFLAGILAALVIVPALHGIEISNQEYAEIDAMRSDCRVDTEVRKHLDDRILDYGEYIRIRNVAKRAADIDVIARLNRSPSIGCEI